MELGIMLITAHCKKMATKKRRKPVGAPSVENVARGSHLRKPTSKPGSPKKGRHQHTPHLAVKKILTIAAMPNEKLQNELVAQLD
jgi:hypothetical protein